MTEIFIRIAEMFSYGFMQRVLIAGPLISLCASLLGVPLVLKKYSMIGDGLSHVGFGALTIAAVLGIAPMYISVPAVIAAAFILLRMNDENPLKGDSAIAVFSTAALAAGVIITSIGAKSTADLGGYMFGSILAMSDSDVIMSVILSAVVLCVFVLFYNRIFSVTFDSGFSEASGVNTKMYDMLISVLTALTIVMGMRLMGTLLISGLIIFPALTAMSVFRSFTGVTICAAIVSVTCFTAGLIISFFMSIPAGASVVAVNVLFLAGFSLIGKARKINR